MGNSLDVVMCTRIDRFKRSSMTHPWGQMYWPWWLNGAFTFGGSKCPEFPSWEDFGLYGLFVGRLGPLGWPLYDTGSWPKWTSSLIQQGTSDILKSRSYCLILCLWWQHHSFSGSATIYVWHTFLSWFSIQFFGLKMNNNCKTYTKHVKIAKGAIISRVTLCILFNGC